MKNSHSSIQTSRSHNRYPKISKMTKTVKTRCHLAAGHVPPGGFWKIQKTRTEQEFYRLCSSIRIKTHK